MGKKFFLTNYFKYFHYFYKHLKFRVFVSLGLNLLIGVLDGVGLALFIPLFKVITEDASALPGSEDYDFISDFILNDIGIAPNLVNLFLLIFSLFTIKGAAKFLESYVRVLYQQIFMRRIRFQNLDLFNELNFLDFVKADKGRIENTFSGEVNRVNMSYVYYFRSLQYGMLVLVYSLLALGSNWKFTLTVIAGGFISNLIFKFFYERTKRLSQKFTTDSHSFMNLVVQKIHLFKYLKATGLNYKYGDKLKGNILRMENTQLKMGYINAIISGIREPLAILIVCSAIFVNVYFFREQIGAMLLSLLLLYRSITFFTAFQEQWNVFLGVSGSISNMQHFENELRQGKEVNGREKYLGISKGITFKDVSFRFGADKPVLSDINLEIRKKEIIAIVGESGAGKSTLMNLATGLLLPTRGKVLIDGRPISGLELNSYRSRLGYIVQDPIIFNDTIFNNITFWAEKSKENYERFERAIDKAVILDFVNSLPEKEDSILGNNGINISGGQRQRLAIARELYKEVDILFMDEATSSLDGETEAIIQNNVKALKGKYTLMIIAHRLATIKYADRIVVLHKGKIEAVGDYQELLSTSPRFRKMIEVQNL